MEVWPDEHPPGPDRLKELLSDKEGVLTNIIDRIDADVMGAAPSLKVISQLGVGVDNIDVSEATRRGILVGNTPGVLAKATADLAFALLMCAARRVSESDRWVRSGHWELAFHPQYWRGMDIHGSTIGIIGLGETGLEMARRARGFDMKVLYHSRNRKPNLEEQYGLEYTDLPTLLRTADFVSLHTALTPETRGLIGEPELRMMQPTAVLINTSRGPVVDSKALYTALQEKWIYAAALDVTSPEPIPADDPLLTLDNVDNVVITPHIASAGTTTWRKTMYLAARNLIAGLQGHRLEACTNAGRCQSLGI